MALWRFFDYITEDGQNLMQGWYDAQEPEVQAQFDATLLILAGTADWEDDEVEEFKPLTERHVGLGEVRFYIDWRPPGTRKPRRRRFRPVGIWPATTDWEFVLILGCEKTRVAYTPRAAFDSALTYKALLEQGRGTTNERI